MTQYIVLLPVFSVVLLFAQSFRINLSISTYTHKSKTNRIRSVSKDVDGPDLHTMLVRTKIASATVEKTLAVYTK